MWASLGYASFGEYIERLFDFDRRLVAERLRVALALETLPRLAEALRRGAVGMGWKQRQAQSLLDRVRPHVGDDPEVGAVLRAALREAPVSEASAVREPVALYERLAA